MLVSKTSKTTMDRLSKQKINKEMQVLNDTLDEKDLIDIFKTFHPNAEEYTFSSPHGIFSKIDHILGHKSNLSKFKKMKSYQASSLTTTLDINTGYQLREKKCKKHRHMEIKQHVSK